MIVQSDEEPEGSDMVLDTFRERQSLPNEPGTALPESAEESFDVIGQARLLASDGMTLGGNHGLVGVPEIGADDRAVAVLLGQRIPEALSRFLGSVAGDHRHDLPRCAIQRHPDPPDVAFGLYETPEFVGFEDEFARFFLSGPGSQGVSF
jgi:hypothetical protein